VNKIDWIDLIESRKSIKDSDRWDCGNLMAKYNDKIIIIEGSTINRMNI